MKPIIIKDRIFVCFNFVNKIVRSIAPPSISPSGLMNHPPPPAYAGFAKKIPIVINENSFNIFELDIVPLFGLYLD